MFSDLSAEEARTLITIFSILVPALFYGMGMMEGKHSRTLFLLGLVLHGLSIIYRGYVLGGIPLTEKHDNVSFMAFTTAVVYWRLSAADTSPWYQVTSITAVSLLAIASLLFPTINTISPFMRTPWFTLHMFLLYLSYGFFGVSACAGIAYLAEGNADRERLQYQLAAYGWAVYTIALVAGSVWFFIAYGMYWLWTSRELFTTLCWFFFGLYLHQRYLKGLAGRPAAIIGLLGYLIALFAYFGVGTIIPAPPVQF
ncbi:MAG: cytochrome c biogenesis protein [Nitrospirota bacterium]|nr:cytochrome c biogenesis protein [Nitrospirota bacterium]